MTQKSAMKPRAKSAQLPRDIRGQRADETGTFRQESAPAAPSPDARAEAHALAAAFPDFFRVDAGLTRDVDTGFLQAAVTSANGSRFWHTFALSSSDAAPVPVPAFKLAEVVETMLNAARAHNIVLHIQADTLGAQIRAIVGSNSIVEDGPHFGLSLARVILAAKAGRK